MKKKCHFIWVLWFFVACNTESNSDVFVENKELRTFFETENINLKLHKRTLKVVVENSALLESKSNENEQSKREYLELYSSLGALILATNLDSNAIECDSISILSKSSLGKDTYVYNYRHLLDVRRNTDICRSFLLTLKNRDYQTSQSYLSSEIKKEIPEAVFFNSFESIFLSKEIVDATLAGFVFGKGLVSLYITIQFSDNVKQTYIFMFVVGEDIISGIQTPD